MTASQTTSEKGTPNSRSATQAAEGFLQSKGRLQQTRRDRLAGTGAAAELGALNSLVRAVAVRLPDPAFVQSPDLIAGIREAFLTDVAQRLALLGFNAGDVRSRARNGEDLVQAAAAAVRGTATFQQYAIQAEYVVLGRVVAVDRYDPRPDGYNSTVTFSVVRDIGGTKRAPERLSLRQMSGALPDGTRLVAAGEIKPELGDEYLLLVSSSLYENHTGIRQRNESTVLPVLVPYRVAQNDILPIGVGVPEAPRSIDELARTVQQ